MRRNKKGFTLMELMAIMIVLALILLIVVPQVVKIVRESKSATNRRSLEAIVRAGEQYYGESIVNESKKQKIENLLDIYGEVEVHGKPKNGRLYVNSDGEVATTVVIGNFCYKKAFNGEIEEYSKEDENCELGYIGNDQTSPIVGIDIKGEKRETGWYTSVPYVVVEASDGESGIEKLKWCIGKSCDASQGMEETAVIEKEDGRRVIELKKAILDTNETELCVEAIDIAGKTSGNVCSGVIRVDTASPEIIGVVSKLTIRLNQEIDLRSGVEVKEEGSGIKGALEVTPEEINVKEAGKTTVIYKAVDNAGNEATKEMEVEVTGDIPEITYSPNAGEWHKENFYVTINVKDNSGHGIKEFNVCTGTTDTCDPSKGSLFTGKTSATRLIETESGNNRICVQAKDNYNQTTGIVCSEAYKLDKSKPTVGSITVNGSSTIKEWYTGDVIVAAVNGTDSVSGHLSTTVDKTSLTESGNVTVTTKDKAGNESTKSYSIKIDKNLPEVTIEEPAKDGTNGWYKTKPTLVLKGTDKGSGLSKIKWCQGVGCTPKTEITTETKEVTINDTNDTQLCLIGYDQAGNESGKKCSSVIKVDTGLPAFSGIGDITVSVNGSVNLTNGVKVSDSLSGVASDTSYTYSPQTVTTNKAGTTTVTYKVVDKAGNEKTITRKVIVSSKPPEVTYSPSAEAWHKENFYVTINVKDNSGHGIKEFNVCTGTTNTCDPSKGSLFTGKTSATRLIETEGSNNRICVQAKDNYNQTSEIICSDAYKLDKSKPTVGSITVNGSSTIKEWYTGNVTIAAVNGTDSVSGHLSTTVDKTSLTGSGSVTVTTKDKAGNESTKSYSIKIDKNKPTCSFSNLSYVGKNKSTSITLTCTNSTSGMNNKTLSASDFTLNNGNISITGVSKEAVTNGYKYVITLKGVTAGSATITLPASKVTTVAGLGNDAKASNAITVTSISLSSTSGSTEGTNLTSTITSSNAGTITCSSNNTNVATCSVSGSTLTVVPGTTAGNATITLTGSNGSPTATYAIANNVVILGLNSTSGTVYHGGSNKTVAITGSNYGSLSCSVNSSGVSVASCSISGSNLTIKPGSQGGQATITVIESKKNKTAIYTVTNKVPSIYLNSTSGSTYTNGSNLTTTISGSNYGTLSCTSSSTSIATCSISGTTLTITPKASSGTATITVTESNGNKTATYRASVNTPSSGSTY